MSQKAAVYARFSSEKQREESIEDQIRVCRDYARSHDSEVVAIYTDEARSGTDASHRPGFQRMVKEAAKGEWSTLIVYKVDRFARNRFDSATYKAKLKRYGIQVVSATEGIPDGPEGIILDSVLEGMAEYYSANLAQNVIRGMEGNALKCRHNGVELFGYKLGDDGMYHVDEDQAVGVRQAFKMYLEGCNRAQIADWLNDHGYRTIRGKRWRVDAVKRLLSNEKYTGVYIWGDVRVEGGMPAIVPSDLFDDVAQILKAAPRRRRGKSQPYLLSGLIYDAWGRKMDTNCGRSHTGAYHYYYRCRETGQSIRRDEADDRVRRAVAVLLADEGLCMEIVDAVMEEQDRRLAADLSTMHGMERRIAEVDRQQDRIIDMASMTDDNERFIEKLNELNRESKQLKAELEEMRAGVPVVEREMVEFFIHKLRAKEAPDAVVRGFVSRVVVGRDNDIWVGFTVNPDDPPDWTPPDDGGDRIENDGSICENDRFGESSAWGAIATSSKPRIYIVVRGGFLLRA